MLKMEKKLISINFIGMLFTCSQNKNISRCDELILIEQMRNQN